MLCSVYFKCIFFDTDFENICVKFGVIYFKYTRYHETPLGSRLFSLNLCAINFIEDNIRYYIHTLFLQSSINIQETTEWMTTESPDPATTTTPTLSDPITKNPSPDRVTTSPSSDRVTTSPSPDRVATSPSPDPVTTAANTENSDSVTYSQSPDPVITSPNPDPVLTTTTTESPDPVTMTTTTPTPDTLPPEQLDENSAAVTVTSETTTDALQDDKITQIEGAGSDLNKGCNIYPVSQKGLLKFILGKHTMFKLL